MKETTVPFQITKAEFQIMNVLWNSNQPLSYSDIINEICKVEELAFSKRSVFGMLVLVRVPPYPCQKSWHYITGEAYPTQAGHSIGINPSMNYLYHRTFLCSVPYVHKVGIRGKNQKFPRLRN